MKTCSKCGETKALTEFRATPKYSQGVYCWCRACSTKDTVQRYVRKRPLVEVCQRCGVDPPRTVGSQHCDECQRAILRERARSYSSANREKIAERRRAKQPPRPATPPPCVRCGLVPRRSFNPKCMYCAPCYQATLTEASKRAHKAAHKNDPETFRAKSAAKARAWRAANPERNKANEKRYRESHPGLAAAKSKRYLSNPASRAKVYTRIRERKRKFAAADLTPEEWEEVGQIYELARESNLTVDHIVPLKPCKVCGATGRHEPANLQLLSLFDNTSKHNRCQTCWEAA